MAHETYRQTLKEDTLVLGRIRRQVALHNARRNSHRDVQHLHASEMCKKDWCPRATWYRLRQIEPDAAPKEVSLYAVGAYEEGHDIHDRYQSALWADGCLEGMYKCLSCGHRWWDISPLVCGACDSVHLIYDEVPVADEELMMIGHADGIVVVDDSRRVLLEIKSIGEGSYRLEVPGMHTRYTKGEITMNEMWKEITRPFPSHLRQANLYARTLELRTIVFIYESKANQQQKEFVVQYHPPLIEGIVAAAKEVKAALESGSVVRRPQWAEDEDHRVCRACPYRATCWSLNGTVQGEDVTDARAVRLFGRKA